MRVFSEKTGRAFSVFMDRAAGTVHLWCVYNCASELE